MFQLVCKPSLSTTMVHVFAVTKRASLFAVKSKFSTESQVARKFPNPIKTIGSFNDAVDSFDLIKRSDLYEIDPVAVTNEAVSFLNHMEITNESKKTHQKVVGELFKKDKLAEKLNYSEHILNLMTKFDVKETIYLSDIEHHEYSHIPNSKTIVLRNIFEHINSAITSQNQALLNQNLERLNTLVDLFDNVSNSATQKENFVTFINETVAPTNKRLLEYLSANYSDPNTVDHIAHALGCNIAKLMSYTTTNLECVDNKTLFDLMHKIIALKHGEEIERKLQWCIANHVELNLNGKTTLEIKEMIMEIDSHPIELRFKNCAINVVINKKLAIKHYSKPDVFELYTSILPLFVDNNAISSRICDNLHLSIQYGDSQLSFALGRNKVFMKTLIELCSLPKTPVPYSSYIGGEQLLTCIMSRESNRDIAVQLCANDEIKLKTIQKLSPRK